MTTATKPASLGTVWESRARIRIIDESGDSPKWITVESCIDTPVAIGNALAKARKTHYGKRMWIHSDTQGKRIS